MKKVTLLFLALLAMCYAPIVGAAANDYSLTMNGKKVEFRRDVATKVLSLAVDGNKIGLGIAENCERCKIYKTNLENTLAIISTVESVGQNVHTAYLDITSGSAVIATQDQSNFACPNTSKLSLVSGYYEIRDTFNDNDCTQEKKITSAKAAKSARPYLANIEVLERNNEGALTAAKLDLKSKSDLHCVYGTFPGENMTMENNVPFTCGTTKKFIGLDKNLQTYYFSLAGKGWQAYYSFDSATKQLVKTTLPKINQSKIKLTLVKSF